MSFKHTAQIYKAINMTVVATVERLALCITQTLLTVTVSLLEGRVKRTLNAHRNKRDLHKQNQVGVSRPDSSHAEVHHGVITINMQFVCMASRKNQSMTAHRTRCMPLN